MNKEQKEDVIIDFTQQEEVKPIPEAETQQEDIKTMIFNTLGVSKSSNPVICIFHIFFKVLSIFIYLFGGIVFNSITIFIFVSVFAVLDFWVVKNLSGRILAGLRWWRVINEEGVEKWIFESKDENHKNNTIDTTFFWYGQIINTLFWSFMSLFKLLTLTPFWFILAGSTFALSSTNLYAYYKCRKDYQKKIKSVMGTSMTMGNVFLGGIKSKLGIQFN